jgi:uncharacterized protein (DUF486 family)
MIKIMAITLIESNMKTILLLIASNSFMTIAWYGHLKYKQAPLVWAILASWLIALPEYALQVPANRIGYGTFTATQLKILQEVISLSVFAIFAWIYFGEVPTWRSILAFLLVVIAVAIVRGRPPESVTSSAPSTPPTAAGAGG